MTPYLTARSVGRPPGEEDRGERAPYGKRPAPLRPVGDPGYGVGVPASGVAGGHVGIPASAVPASPDWAGRRVPLAVPPSGTDVM